MFLEPYFRFAEEPEPAVAAVRSWSNIFLIIFNTKVLYYLRIIILCDNNIYKRYEADLIYNYNI